MIRASLPLACLVCLLSLAGTAAARGGAIALPPAEVDVGATTPVGGGETGPATQVLVGVHWASLAWRPTRYEVGAGYVGAFSRLRPGLADRTTGGTSFDDRLRLNGIYLALGRTLVSRTHFRTWIELRGELLHGRTDERSFSALGGAARLALEVFSSGSKAVSDPGALVVFAGTVALGVYVEASHRDLASELGPTGVTTGISFRIPFLFAAVN